MTTIENTDYRPLGVPDPNDPTDTMTPWGYCASFCIQDGPTNGASVEDHSSHCESLGYGVEAHDARRDEAYISTRAARSYHHGTVHRSLIYGSARNAKVQLSVSGRGEAEEFKQFYLTPGEARSLARHLSLSADVADGCTGDPNTALEARQREERAARA